ncbi:MAG: hypothetical protein EA397_12950 [Deltaproteobacteria bacterium]|nr:MAG: hypothetical protein EA397_12950 [Deltaproteobacteria bacterium]
MVFFLLATHSILRWLVILLGLAAIGQAGASLATGQSFQKRHRYTNLAFVLVLHLQVVLGIALYAGLGPTMPAVFGDFGAAMKSPVLRFWAVEHISGMVLGVVIATVGNAVSKRAKQDKRRHLAALVGFTIGLLLILASIPWPFMAAGRPLLPGM